MASVALSIKDVPAHIAQALKTRAARNHRSIQGELMHILEQALTEEEQPFNMKWLLKELDRHKLPRTTNGSTAMIRELRDSRWNG